MKRCNIVTLGIFLLFLLFLTGCNHSADITKDTPNTSTSQEQTTEGGVISYQADDVATVEANILEKKESIDDQGVLWYVPNQTIEQGTQQELRLYQGNLLLSGWDYSNVEQSVLKLAIISLDTGDVLKETTLSQIEISDVQICSDYVVVSDWADGEVRILNSELEIVKEYQTGTEYGTIYVNPDATKVFCFTEETGVQIVDMETGNKKVLLNGVADLYANKSCGNVISLSYVDKETLMTKRGVVDLETEEFQEVPFSGAFVTTEYNDGVWLAQGYGNDKIYYIGNSMYANTIESLNEDDMVSFIYNPSRILVSNYRTDGSSALRLYDMNGEFLSECILDTEGSSLFYNPVWIESKEGYLFTVTDTTGKDVLLFWDTRTKASGDALTFEVALRDDELPVGDAVDVSLYNKAKEISAEYGVSIHIAEQIDTDFSDFVAEKELSEEYVSAGLTALENVLSSYPKGYMKQLLYGEQVEIEIHLAGLLTKTTIPEGEVSGFTSFAGFVQEQGGKSIVVIDVTSGTLEQHLYHEIMHLTDNKLAFDARIREGAIYSEEGWNALNPEGFVYAEDFNDLPMDIYNEAYDEWFVDLYARTFANEDRARIMEYAMAEIDWSFQESSKRLAKLEYLCKCIRDSFDTTGWPEQTVWESTLMRCKK